MGLTKQNLNLCTTDGTKWLFENYINITWACSLRTIPLALSPGQVKLDSDKWKLWKNLFKFGFRARKGKDWHVHVRQIKGLTHLFHVLKKIFQKHQLHLTLVDWCEQVVQELMLCFSPHKVLFSSTLSLFQD